MKLYAFPASPFARKIRVVLLEKGIGHEVEMVGDAARERFREVNPLGKVPALELPDGRVLINSPVIADYLDSRFPGPRFIPDGLDARFEVKNCEALADGVAEAVIAILYEARFHEGPHRSRAWVERQAAKAEAGLAALERALGAGDWIAGGEMSLADIAIACHAAYITLRAPQYFPQQRYPNLARLWKRMEARDSMRRTAPPPS